MNGVIEIENLSKRFGVLIAVDHINLSIEEGEIFGFLGPNGAGKTTVIKILCTILNPSSGSARVCGYDVVRQKDEVRRHIGIVFQDPSIDTFLTGRENLDFHARMYHMDKRTREKRIEEVLDLLDLKGQESKTIRDCSGGTQRRFEVARGLLNRPKVLFLDEPTLGLDVQTRRDLWRYIRILNKEEGTTIVLTTHYIEEADFLCSRVAVLDQGKIVAMDTPERLKEAVGSNLILLKVVHEVDNNRLDLLKQLDWVKGVKVEDSTLKLSVDRAEERIAKLIDFADEHGIIISSVKVYKPNLEDAFLHYTGKTIRDESGNLMDLFKAWMTRNRSRK